MQYETPWKDIFDNEMVCYPARKFKKAKLHSKHGFAVLPLEKEASIEKVIIHYTHITFERATVEQKRAFFALCEDLFDLGLPNTSSKRDNLPLYDYACKLWGKNATRLNYLSCLINQNAKFDINCNDVARFLSFYWEKFITCDELPIYNLWTDVRHRKDVIASKRNLYCMRSADCDVSGNPSEPWQSFTQFFKPEDERLRSPEGSKVFISFYDFDVTKMAGIIGKSLFC